MLSLKEIQEDMQKLKNWGLEMDTIVKDYTFNDFKEAMDFVKKVGELCEKHNKYPNIIISHRIVRIALTAYSEFGLSHEDFALAGEIEQLTG